MSIFASAHVTMLRMKVFVSSTCYDLLDLRREVEEHLREMGLSPVLSDRRTSDFELVDNVDSIETCLVNVRSADAFVCIVSQRYGALLPAAFGGISATHLEWQEARKQPGKKIRFYVRDQTLGDHANWKKNPDQDKFPWVKDLALLKFLDEHKKLDPGAPNWVTTFRDSVELKECLTADFGTESRVAIVRALLKAGALPMLTIAWDSRTGNDVGILVTSHGHAALRVQIYVSDDGTKEVEDLFRDTPRRFKIAAAKEGPTTIRFTYQTVQGYGLQDDFDMHLLPDRPVFRHLAKRFVGVGPFFKIE